MKIKMSDEIENKVAKSNLITIELKDFHTPGDKVEIDIKKWLFNEVVLKEKVFRDHLKEHDWTIYKGKFVAIHCSIDTIIPVWAFMLVTSYLQPFAEHIYFGNKIDMEKQLFQHKISLLDSKKFTNKKVLVKGCSDIFIPENAYIEISNKLLKVVQSLMFGEACSNVPLFKRKT